MRPLCIDAFEGFDTSQIYSLVKEAGFDGIFVGADDADDLPGLEEIRKKTDALGLFRETVHSTIKECWKIWMHTPEGDDYARTLLRNVDYCAAIGTPLLIIHPQTNLNPASMIDTELGLSRFAPVVSYAKEKGVRLAVENIDDENLFAAMMDRFREPHVGFCYDSGHDWWLTPNARLLQRFGDRLLCLHLHDNDQTWDRHMIPFDGTLPFDKVCAELKDCRFAGPVTLEVARSDIYKEKYTEREFLSRCYTAAVRLRDMLDG